MARKRIDDPQVRREQILAAAQKALTKKHFRDLSMDDIARVAGISKGLLYLYFKDKDQLFAAVTLGTTADLHARITAAHPHADPRMRLIHLTRALFEFGEQHREFVYQFVPEQLLSSPHSRAIMESYGRVLHTLSAIFKSAMREGYLQKRDPRAVAFIYMDLLRSYFSRKYIHGELPRPIESYSAEIVDLFVNGWGRRPR